MSDFYSQQQVKARKEHKCYWCGDTIMPGEKYYRVAGIYEGDFSTRKECDTCNTTVAEYCEQNRENGVEHEDLINHWQWERCRKCHHWDIVDRECNIGDMTHATKCTNFIWEDSL